MIPSDQLTRDHCFGGAQIVQWLRQKSREPKTFSRCEQVKNDLVSVGGQSTVFDSSSQNYEELISPVARAAQAGFSRYPQDLAAIHDDRDLRRA